MWRTRVADHDVRSSPVKAAPCTRPLAQQAEDRSGSRRRGDHALRRLDLLTDAELDAYRERFGSEALDASEVLAEGIERQRAKLEEVVRGSLEGRTESRPILSVVVCLSCGVFDVARASRAWAVDRAMRRSGLGEREVLGVLALLAEAGSDGNLDGLSAEKLRELSTLLGQDVDLESVRLRYGN